MEKIIGEDLQEWLNKKQKRITQKLALQWLRQLVEILAEVHQKQFFHRDIKPANIMLRPTGQLALIDFGTVKEITATFVAKQQKGQAATVAYTPGYAPPEQEKGHPLPQSDFFALGRTFVHLLTGEYPLNFYNPQTDELNWRSEVANLSPLVGNLIDELMQRLSSHRPADTSVILQKLDDIEKNLYPSTSAQTLVVNLPFQKSLNSKKSKNISLKNKFKNNKNTRFAVGLTAILSLILVSQIYSYFRFGLFPSNPIRLILPSTMFSLQRGITAHFNGVYSVAISADGKTIVTGGRIIIAGGRQDHSVKVWNAKTGKKINTFQGNNYFLGPGYLVAISADGKTIITAGSAMADVNVSINIAGPEMDDISVWNAITGEKINFFSTFRRYIKLIAISADGETITDSGRDDINVWNTKIREKIHTFRVPSNSSTSLAISSNGETIVSGSKDKNINVWNTKTGKLVLTLKGHSRSVISVAISSDGETIVSGSKDKSIKVWNLK